MLVEKFKRLLQNRRAEWPLRLLRNPRAAWPLLLGIKSTFSQYGEDHLINILLSPGTKGTYVDVGSHHPFQGSNTYGLYLRGWRGLTVDPNPEFSDAYARFRPHEPHLVEGVSDTHGSMTYYGYDCNVYNTLSDQRAADLAHGGTMATTRSSVTTRPLHEMVDEHLGGRPIDLLSVDCEGLDFQVIRSLDLTRNRPTVIIMEDYARLAMFRSGEGQSMLHSYLVDNGYNPFAQLAFSALYIAHDYRALMSRSEAFNPARIQGGILSS